MIFYKFITFLYCKLISLYEKFFLKKHVASKDSLNIDGYQKFRFKYNLIDKVELKDSVKVNNYLEKLILNELYISSIIENNFMMYPQDENLVTYAKKIKKEEAKISWGNSAEEIHKKIMAFNQWPIAETTLSGERIRIHDSEYRNLDINGIPGNIKSVDNDLIQVFTKEGLLIIKKLQKDNSKILNSKDFINSTDLKGKKFV